MKSTGFPKEPVDENHRPTTDDGLINLNVKGGKTQTARNHALQTVWRAAD